MTETTNQNLDPNSRQVAGQHYRATYQHWDWVIRNKVPYLPAQASRYVSRARKKGRWREDMEKAMHYVEKMKSIASLEVEDNRLANHAVYRQDQNLCMANTMDFCIANELNLEEYDVISLVANFRFKHEIDEVLAKLQNMLDKA